MLSGLNRRPASGLWFGWGTEFLLEPPFDNGMELKSLH
jgi:hypothetical protein